MRSRRPTDLIDPRRQEYEGKLEEEAAMKEAESEPTSKTKRLPLIAIGVLGTEERSGWRSEAE